MADNSATVNNGRKSTPSVLRARFIIYRILSDLEGFGQTSRPPLGLTPSPFAAPPCAFPPQSSSGGLPLPAK